MLGVVQQHWNIDTGVAYVVGSIVLVAGGAIGKWWTDRHHDRLASVIAEQSAATAQATARAAKDAADGIAQQLMRELSTQNGHTIGMGIARLEDGQWKLGNRLDRVEVIATETQTALTQHVDDVAVQAADYFENVKPVVDRLRLEQAAEGIGE